MALRDIPATIRRVICIHHPECAKSKTIVTAESHGVPLLVRENESRVVHLQDNMARIVNIAKTRGESSVAVDIIDVTYRR